MTGYAGTEALESHSVIDISPCSSRQIEARPKAGVRVPKVASYMRVQHRYSTGLSELMKREPCLERLGIERWSPASRKVS